jgi:hypothetical protein
VDVDALHEFSTGQDEDVRATVGRLVDAIERSGISLDRAIKWRRLTFAVDGDFRHWICGIDVTRRGVVLQLHFGSLLRDPEGQLTASESRFLRTMTFRTADSVDADADAVAGFVRAAVERLPFFRAHWREVQARTIDPAQG